VFDETPRPLRAALVAVQLPDVTDAAFAASVEELHRLGRTLGVDVVETFTQRRAALHPGTVLGSGKLASLKALTGGAEVAGAPSVEETDEGESDDDGDAEAADGAADAAGSPGPHVEVVLVDHEITPSQARNLEKATGA